MRIKGRDPPTAAKIYGPKAKPMDLSPTYSALMDCALTIIVRRRLSQFTFGHFLVRAHTYIHTGQTQRSRRSECAGRARSTGHTLHITQHMHNCGPARFLSAGLRARGEHSSETVAPISKKCALVHRLPRSDARAIATCCRRAAVRGAARAGMS